MRKLFSMLGLDLLVRAAIRLLVVLGIAGLVGPQCFAQTVATYDATSRYLMLPSVQTQGTTYTNVVIRLDSVAIVNLGSAAPTFAGISSPATYDDGTRYLTLPSVSAMGTTYYGLVARIDGFALISVDPPPEPVAPPVIPYPMYGYGY